MDGLVLHPQTARQIERYIQHPAHAILIAGPEGSGKGSLLQAAAARLTGRRASEISGYAYFKQVVPEKDKASISIEAVRELQHFTMLRLPGGGLRIIAIEDADRLTAEAQNGLLKLLEEPPAGTLFMLSADSAQGLLPTIRSRVQIMTLHRPAKADTEAYFMSQGYESAAIAQAYFLSGGLPGLMAALLGDDDHPLRQSVQLARGLLQMTQFERLAKVDVLNKDRTAALQLLFILQQMAHAAIEQTAARAASSGAPADTPLRQWQRVLRAAHDAEQAYAVSAQAKLTLTNLMLAL